jgi:hypothetical protein
MHNIKDGHDAKPSVGDTFVNYTEDFKKTKTAEAKKFFFFFFFANSKCWKKGAFIGKEL